MKQVFIFCMISLLSLSTIQSAESNYNNQYNYKEQQKANAKKQHITYDDPTLPFQSEEEKKET